MRTIRSRMTPLRQRMLEDMQLRNYSAHTIRAYLHCVADFARHFRTSPAHLGPELVRTYQLFLVQEKQVAWPSVVQTVCALRFFFVSPWGARRCWSLSRLPGAPSRCRPCSVKPRSPPY